MIKKLQRKLGRSRRKTVPRTERIGSLVILLLVAGVGVAVAVKGGIYDPGRYELNEAALAGTATSATVTGAPAAEMGEPSAVATEGSPEGIPAESAHGSEPTAAPAAPAGQEPLTVSVAGTQPAGETEFYNPDDLYIKVDGRADAYLAFEFVQLRCRTFNLVDSPDGAYVDVYAYQMGQPINAYGIYALERDPKGDKLDFGEDGYRSGMGYFLRQGSVYLQVLASDQSEATLAKAEAIARELIGRIPADSAGLEGRLALPEAGQVPGTIGFDLHNAQGQSFLSHVFSSDYTAEGKTLRFFIAVEADEAAARDVLKQYRDFCEQFGKVEKVDAAGADMFKAEIFGTWKIIYQRGADVGGVIDTDSPDIAIRFVQGLLAKK